MSIRDEIARLSAEHDRLMCGHHQWMAQRKAASGAPVQKSDEPDILYRVTDNNSLQPAPEPDAEASDADEGSDDWRTEISTAIGEVIVELRREWRAEREAELIKRDRRISELESELREMKGMLGAVLAMLGRKPNLPTMGKSEVVDLPKGFLRRVHNG